MRQFGILPHGRHLQTPNWEGQMWGDPTSGKFGTLSASLAIALDQFAEGEPVGIIALATGASRRTDGTMEATAMRELMMDRLPDLGEFAGLRASAVLADPGRLREFSNHVQGIIAVGSLKTINTRQELTLASEMFDQKGVTDAVHVTSSSHAPRCTQLVSELRAEGAINTKRRWMLMADDMSYPGTTAAETLIIEVPHRGDDPALGLSITAHDAFRGYFGMTAANKDALHRQVKSFIRGHVPKQTRSSR